MIFIWKSRTKREWKQAVTLAKLRALAIAPVPLRMGMGEIRNDVNIFPKEYPVIIYSDSAGYFSIFYTMSQTNVGPTV